jgi:hypothetical protein
MDRVVDRGAGEAPDFQEVPALRLELRHMLDLLLAHVLEVDDDAVGAGLGDDPVEGDDDDPRVAGLLDGAVRLRGRPGDRGRGEAAPDHHRGLTTAQKAVATVLPSLPPIVGVVDQGGDAPASKNPTAPSGPWTGSTFPLFKANASGLSAITAPASRR